MNHFKGKQFQQDVIIIAVGYYLRYNLSYREVQELLLEDTAYQEDKARKAETEDKLAIEAMKSKYTTLLLENMLLSPCEMQDTKIMAGLQVHVYPLYDELKELRGLNSVKDHLSYVASRREEYSKHNIARYLKKAIEQYLPTVKRQDLNHE